MTIHGRGLRFRPSLGRGEGGVIDTFNVAMLILRVWAGIVFLAHGVKHAKGRQKTGKWLQSIGYKNPDFQWFSMTATEIGAGLLLIAGLLTSLAAAALVATMVVAYLTVHRTAGFWVTARPDEGWEYAATLVAMGVAVAIAGPGEISLDDAFAIATKLDGWVGAIIVGGGAVMGLAQVTMFFKPTNADSG